MNEVTRTLVSCRIAPNVVVEVPVLVKREQAVPQMIEDAKTGKVTQSIDETVLDQAEDNSFPKKNLVIKGQGIDYKIIRKIGPGGMGEVWEAEALYRAKKGARDDVRRPVALKFVNEFFAKYLEDLFIKEAKITARLNHDNIVRFEGWDYLEDHNMYMISIEYINGCDLNGFMRNHNILPRDKNISLQDHLLSSKIRRIPDEIVGFILFSVANALDYAHNFVYDGSMGIIHRDVSPGNVLIKADEGSVKLGDFGIAVTTEDLQKSQSGVTAGKLHYMAPEQIFDCKAVDARSDLYSLGAVGYELLTGISPNQRFDETGNEVEDVKKTVSMYVRELTPPHQVVQGVSQHLSEIIHKLLSTEPKERYQSAAELVEAIGKGYLYKTGFGPTKPFLRDYMRMNESLEGKVKKLKWRNQVFPIPLTYTDRARMILEAGMNPARD